MGEKSILKFLEIVLCIVLVTGLCTIQTCRRKQPSSDQTVSLGISSEDSSPSWSPDGTKIVFESNRAGSIDIYMMNADGSNPTRLTDNLSDDENSSWSPDGNEIAFDSDRNGNRDIYTMNANGSNQTRLTDNPGGDNGPSWSPDGAKIVFFSNRDKNRELYTMNADGSNQTRLTDNPAHDVWPSWSPDGTRIAFNSNRDGNWEIYTMNADGSNQIRLTDNPARDYRPSWSPDSRKFTFVSYRDGNPEIYTMNADGSDQTRITNEPFGEYMPSWSPDGRKIVFISDRDFDSEVYVMDVDGFNPVNLTNNAPINAAYGLAPLPRSELDLDKIPYKIVFESYRETDGKENWDICLMDADGSNLINLTNTPEIDEMYPHASPDGSRICFVADEGDDKENKRRNVYIMNIDGTGRIKIAENAYQPFWSPDGRHVAYLPGEFPRYEPYMRANKGLEIYDLETRKTIRHPNDELIHLARLCWSPDGKWLVAAGGRGGLPGGENVFKADDKTMMRLSIQGCTPDISPDGNNLAWNGTDWNINIGTLDFSSRQRNVTDHKVVIACDRDHWVYHADWSPDGKYLAFSYSPFKGGDTQTRPAPGANICVCNLRTGKWTQVTTDGKHNKEPDWVPVQVR